MRYEAGSTPVKEVGGPIDSYAECGSLNILREAPEWTNPALLMAWELKARELSVGLDMDYLIEHSEAIQDAMEEGAEETKKSARSIELLKRAAGMPASVAPVGF